MSEDLFWNRRVRLTIGNNEPPNNAVLYGADPECNHRIDFNIKKTRDASKNSGTISIYNLSKQERNAIDEEYERIILNLGYQGVTPLSQGDGFWGDVVNGLVHKVSHRRSGVDTVTELTYIESGFQLSRKTFTKTYGRGIKYSSIVKDIARRSMPNITIGDISGIDKDSSVIRTLNITGMSFGEIEKIAKNHDARATINNETLEIISNDKFIKPVRGIPLFTSETGLLGDVVKTEKGILIKTLLHPHIKPNILIAVRDDILGEGASKKTITKEQKKSKEKKFVEKFINYQEGIGGVYRVNQVVFSGSNRSGSFTCEIEGQSTDGYRVKRPILDYNPHTIIVKTQNTLDS